MEDNVRYWKLLNLFYDYTGIPAILNTSLNERSMPMIAHPTLALAMFSRTAMDVLVIENIVFRKRY